MPTVNGNQHRTFGQGYAIEKGKAQAQNTPEPKAEGEPSGKGQVTHIKDHGDGNYSVKHHDGEVSKHSSKQELIQHLEQHLPEHGESGSESDGENEGEEYGSDALDSILA